MVPSFSLPSILNLHVFLQLLVMSLILQLSSQTIDPTNAMCAHDTANLNTWADIMSNYTYRPSSLDTSRFNHNLVSQCPSFPNAEHSGHANNLSLCPWTYEIDTDYNRFPHQMPYARCICGQCPTRNPFTVHHRCQPLYHGFQVMRRVCENSSYRYYNSNEMLPVACVCSHLNVRIVPLG